MTVWQRLTTRHKPQSLAGNHVLSLAYRAVFRGNPDRTQQEIVSADLANKTGFYKVTSPETAEQRIWFNEGKRAAFAEIFGHLSLSDEDMRALENAARHEANEYDNAQFPGFSE